MPFVRLLLNILWIITGGLWMAALWLLAAIIMVITIVGIPWARAAFNIALYTLLPFGQTAVDRADYTGQEDVGTGPLGTIGNLIWLAAGRMVARPRPLDHRARSGDHDHWPALRLGASEACRHRPVADRQNDRPDRGPANRPLNGMAPQRWAAGAGLTLRNTSPGGGGGRWRRWIARGRAGLPRRG